MIHVPPVLIKAVSAAFVFYFRSYNMACRCLTKEEVIIQGLVTGRDAPLEVREGGCAARGVFATASVTKGQWLCEYKGLVYPYSEREKHLEEYDKNKEGCYIVSSKYPVGDGFGH